MILKIDGKEYTLEYTFEASLCDECVQTVMDFFKGVAADPEEALKTLTSVPHTVITLFWAGLLEHYPEITKEEARDLLKKYFKETRDNEEVENNTFPSMFKAIFGQMSDDGFFEQIGLDALMKSDQAEEEEKKTPKKKTSPGKK